MPIDKTLVTRSTSMLILKLLENQDMYGYQMIEELARRSDDTFSLKAGTLYPLLHDLEKEGAIHCCEGSAAGRIRKYYSLTKAGR
ncbi:MAG: helix-turn-helix transcriptional regulator, partial [Clostridia bacterium]|nr:helix-turn-helix transcriptional regulator [Clostridia bacterium]